MFDFAGRDNFKDGRFPVQAFHAASARQNFFGAARNDNRECNMQLSMKDRVAVVTGGSKGIGIAVARRFAESGAKVAILARGAADLAAAREALAKDGLAVRDYVCDVAKAADITKAHDQIIADLGKIDVLVNNAGTARTLAFEGISDEAWQEDLDLKLFAAIRFSRLVWPGMKQRKWGRIINVLNTFAKAPAGNSAPTSVSRAAGMALTKVMANEGGEHNILVNALLVGLIMSDQWVKRHAAQAPDTDFGEFAKGPCQGDAARPHRHGGGVRQPRLLPGLGARLLHHRHRDQCRWWPVAGCLEPRFWFDQNRSSRFLALAGSNPGQEATAQKQKASVTGGLFVLNRVLGGLDRPSADDLPGRLGLEHHLFAGEGVGALARLGRRLLDHNELREAGDEEHPGLLQLLVADIDERVQNVLDVALGEFGGGRDLLDHLRLRQLGSHGCSIDSGVGTIWRKTPRKTVFSALPTTISLWTAPESGIFPVFFPVKALPTPKITGFARLRGSRNGTSRESLPAFCAASARQCGAQSGLRCCGTPLQVSETILQKTEALENDSGSTRVPIPS
ncbi:NAD(P)-dependent dehydrogenase (short-subunit alcohol dehydrogenase family) [Bradyrhizobium sp. USDA 3364]